MEGSVKKKSMSVEDFFEALASNEDFIFAVAHTNSFKKNVQLCKTCNDLIQFVQV